MFTLQSLLALAALLAPLASLQVAASPVVQERNIEERGVNVGWPYGSQKIRGVNIGGVCSPFEPIYLFIH